MDNDVMKRARRIANIPELDSLASILLADDIARAILADREAQAERMARLPATRPYVERIIRIFRDRPGDDTSAAVLTDYANAARALAKEGSDA